MAATLGDHRGVIKAAVTVVNRGANKGSRGWRDGESRGGKDVKEGRNGGLSLLCPRHCLFCTQ